LRDASAGAQFAISENFRAQATAAFQKFFRARRNGTIPFCPRRDRKRRHHLMERSFAAAANNHHFKRARWRRLWRQQIQDYLIASIQNMRILLAPKVRSAAWRQRYFLLC
jgi:hypothetical protein